MFRRCGGVFGVSASAQAYDAVAGLKTIDVAVGADDCSADFAAKDFGFGGGVDAGAKIAGVVSVSLKSIP